MRKPRLTKLVLEGISEALCRMEADDLSDLPKDDWAAMTAADEWLAAMYQWRREKAEQRKAKKGTH